MPVLPDMNARSHVLADRRANAIFALVGVPVLSLSTWLCYVGVMSDEARSALEKSELGPLYRL